MLKKIIGKWNAIIRGLRILNREYFSTRNDCLGKCGINSHYLPPTLLGKRENIFLYDNAYIDYRSVLYVTGGKLIIKENSIVAEGLTAITGQHQSKIGEVFGKAGNSNLLEKDIIVEEDVWIGASVMLLSGAHIGRGAIIGAKGRSYAIRIFRHIVLLLVIRLKLLVLDLLLRKHWSMRGLFMMNKIVCQRKSYEPIINIIMRLGLDKL
ncbi:hypothetical protein NXW45_09485 [Bacteroides caccae]|uniref:hypothetical protein n=1 Tax=Bacteroides caccae TaxID=47678 RepID=UPI0021650ECC|nr:hypothetical protein [Bacteroides caccae]